MFWYLYTALHCGLFSGPNVTFVLTDNNLTWAEARSFCGEHYTDLASVRNLTENQKVQDLVPGGTVWIGLFRVSLKWSDGSKSTFRHWRAYSGKPGDKERNETCVAADFSTSGRWAALSCDWKRAFICYSGKLSVTALKYRFRFTLIQLKKIPENNNQVMDIKYALTSVMLMFMKLFEQD